MELVEVALTVRTALISGVSVPTDNWMRFWSQKKVVSSPPNVDPSWLNWTAPVFPPGATPPVSAQIPFPEVQTLSFPSERIRPVTSRFPSNVDVEVCPFAFMNPAKVEVAAAPLTFKTAPMVEEGVTSNVRVPALANRVYERREGLGPPAEREPVDLDCMLPPA